MEGDQGIGVQIEGSELHNGGILEVKTSGAVVVLALGEGELAAVAFYQVALFIVAAYHGNQLVPGVVLGGVKACVDREAVLGGPGGAAQVADAVQQSLDVQPSRP